ncbi:MAG: alpha/beta fold hydrolase, partial [Dehalococcoidia bacterium]
MADAAPTTIVYRDRTLDISGRRVFVREAIPHTATTEALVLLHGWVGTSSWMFRRMMPELGARYHTIAPDLPGFGGSRTMAELPSIDAYVDFLSR